MMRRSELLAAELGCSHTYAVVTGCYSQRIFTRLGHTTLNTVHYDDFRSLDIWADFAFLSTTVTIPGTRMGSST